MRSLLLFLILVLSTFFLHAQCLKVCSWNIANLGKSKDATEIAYISKKIKDFDFVGIQEVSTSPAGAQAVAKIVDNLNRSGSSWEYIVSDPTNGNGPERYAFLWKKSKAKMIKKAWIEKSLDKQI